MSGQPPPEFDGYRLERLLGRGAMGEVHVAEDTVLERKVAIKFVLASQNAEARQRFLVEARAVARLQHPNVVAVHRVGEVAGVPYLVSELVEGRTLAELALPVDSATVLRIAMDLASGLAAAHRRGVVHRDIKPANAILSVDGAVKLLDFGIAKLQGASNAGAGAPGPSPTPTSSERAAAVADDADPDATPRAPIDEAAALAEDAGLTRTGALVGTPRYMAPELWSGAVATFRSDVYSFGALLYALSSGKPPHDAKDVVELRSRALGGSAPPLASRAPGADPRLAAIVDRCLAPCPADRFADGSEVRSAIALLLPGARREEARLGNPYRGLRAFDVDDTDLFFGRDSETRMLLDRLRDTGFVLVAGDSGVGKSSLVRAGVLPRASERLGGDKPWRIVSLVPGRNPVAALAAALAPQLGQGEAELVREITDDPSGVARRVRAPSAEHGGMLVFVDQLEELVTLSEPAEAAAAAHALSWLAQPAPRARLVATIRADYLGRIAALTSLGDLVQRALFFARPLTKERIREAIVEPARLSGGRFEPPELVDALVDSAASPGALPLLQFALAELWDARRSDVVSRDTLEAVGGVAGALGRHADSVLASMSNEERAAARAVLVRLVTDERTRNRLKGSELTGDEAGRRALDALVRGRLVVAGDGEAEPTFEIAHETLVAGGWPTLSMWLDEDAGSERARGRLQRAAEEWNASGRPSDLLLAQRQLTEALAVDASRLGALERGYVAASRRVARNRSMARIAFAVALPALAGSAALAVHWHQENERDRRIDAELASATSLVTDARAIQAEAERQKAEALRLFAEAGSQERAEAAWARHRERAAEARSAFNRATGVLESAIVLDTGRRDARAAFADVLLEQTVIADGEHDLARRDDLLARLAVHDEDGTRLAAWRQPARLEVVIDPPHAQLGLSAIQIDPAGRYVEQTVADANGDLAAGSYIAELHAPDRAKVRLPFVVRRGERLSLTLALPQESDVPEGFVYVPPGRFSWGSAAADEQRRDFFHHVPLHTVETSAYLIAKHETTFGAWLAYLDALPPDEAEKRSPRVGKGGFQGGLEVRRDDQGAWRLKYQPTDTPHEAKEGERITYPGRKVRSSHDWLALPVVGIRADDAEDYARWLRVSGRVAGARLCSELEWERAARGADGREYPHGERLLPDEANIDATYGKIPSAMGPDEVGSHPASVSPFGVEDLAGNVWEWTRSSLGSTGYVARGGSFAFGPASARVTDREETEPSFRDTSVGVRICADAPEVLRVGILGRSQ